MPKPVKLFCVACLRDTQHMPGGSPMVMSCDCNQPYVNQTKDPDIHRRLSDIIMVAKHDAKDHNCNYNIIISNPVDGELGDGSTYEFVADSYFEKDRPNTKLIATTMQLGVIIYDEWLKYTEYEKQECDIKLSDGTIIYHCYPNAGKFNTMCADSLDPIPEEQVKEIMYRKYYLDDLCKGNCNNEEREVLPVGDLNKAFPDFKGARLTEGAKAMMADFGVGRRTVPVRTEPKIQRNAPCPCGSGKKHKKCCLNK